MSAAAVADPGVAAGAAAGTSGAGAGSGEGAGSGAILCVYWSQVYAQALVIGNDSHYVSVEMTFLIESVQLSYESGVLKITG
jgi:hypothetical protein